MFLCEITYTKVKNGAFTIDTIKQQLGIDSLTDVIHYEILKTPEEEYSYTIRFSYWALDMLDNQLNTYSLKQNFFCYRVPQHKLPISIGLTQEEIADYIEANVKEIFSKEFNEEEINYCKDIWIKVDLFDPFVTLLEVLKKDFEVLKVSDDIKKRKVAYYLAS